MNVCLIYIPRLFKAVFMYIYSTHAKNSHTPLCRGYEWRRNIAYSKRILPPTNTRRKRNETFALIRTRVSTDSYALALDDVNEKSARMLFAFLWSIFSTLTVDGMAWHNIQRACAIVQAVVCIYSWLLCTVVWNGGFITTAVATLDLLVLLPLTVHISVYRYYLESFPCSFAIVLQT